jgi:hypothetical protein
VCSIGSAAAPAQRQQQGGTEPSFYVHAPSIWNRFQITSKKSSDRRVLFHLYFVLPAAGATDARSHMQLVFRTTGRFRS